MPLKVRLVYVIFNAITFLQLLPAPGLMAIPVKNLPTQSGSIVVSSDKKTVNTSKLLGVVDGKNGAKYSFIAFDLSLFETSDLSDAELVLTVKQLKKDGTINIAAVPAAEFAELEKLIRTSPQIEGSENKIYSAVWKHVFDNRYMDAFSQNKVIFDVGKIMAEGMKKLQNFVFVLAASDGLEIEFFSSSDNQDSNPFMVYQFDDAGGQGPPGPPGPPGPKGEQGDPSPLAPAMGESEQCNLSIQGKIAYDNSSSPPKFKGCLCDKQKNCDWVLLH